MTQTNRNNTSTILEEVTRFYVESRDFNGIPASELSRIFDLTDRQLADDLSSLVKQRQVSIVFGDIHPNPHIRAFPDEPMDSQFAKLRTGLLTQACVYPVSDYLQTSIDHHKYEGKPYTLALALGAPQLDFKAFDLSVLEYYRNDPRYYYETDDIDGSISVSDSYFESKEMAQSDQVVLQTFGFCYDAGLNRAVAVFIRYLSDLTLEHQQIWKSKELTGDFILHPDYYRNSILGDWGTKISICSAFLEELHIINTMADVMTRPPLFKEDFSKNSAPREFSFLVRPTLKELNAFILLLDKMISDNISKDFFKNEVSKEYEETRPDGRIVIHQKGSVSMLDEWLHKKYRTNDWQPINEMIACFKNIRRKRQRPAHALEEDVFDQEYFRQQRELIIEAYESIRTLRLLFANSAGCKNVPISDFVRKGEIWDR